MNIRRSDMVNTRIRIATVTINRENLTVEETLVDST